MEYISFISTSQLFYEEFWQRFLLAGVLFVAVFAFQAIALYTIAKREGYKNSWMAFVPILSTYYMGVCAQKNKVMGFSTKQFAIYTAIVELVAVVGYLLFYISEALVFDFIIDEVYTTPYEFLPVQILTDYAYSPLLPENLQWATYIYDNSSRFLTIMELAYYVLMVFLLISFFKTYAPRNYYLFSIFGIFLPIKGIFAFTIRNNKGKSYADFIRSEREKEYYIRQQFYRNNPYDYNEVNGNNYGTNPYYQDPFSQNQTTRPAEDPFGDFSSNSNSNNRTNSGYNNNSQSTPPPKDPFDDF